MKEKYSYKNKKERKKERSEYKITVKRKKDDWNERMRKKGQ